MVKALNELLQAGPIDEGGKSPFAEIGKDIRTKLAAENLDEGEKYFFRLLNRLCLQNKFLKGNLEADAKQAVKLALSDKKGWAWEFSQPPLKTGLTATASAVLALAEINEMLDARINHMILAHFSVKKKIRG